MSGEEKKSLKDNKKVKIIALIFLVLIVIAIIVLVLNNSKNHKTNMVNSDYKLNKTDKLDTEGELNTKKKLVETQLSENNLNLKVGEEAKLVLTLKIDGETVNEKYSWYVSNKDVASISEDGVVKGVGVGETDVYVVYEDVENLKMYQEKCHVIVTAVTADHQIILPKKEVVTYNYKNILEAVEKKNAVCPTYVNEDGITYLSGTKDCINFNYVWYSGKMWRIVAIYPDGVMKLVTNNSITSGISWGENKVFEDSHVYHWLNEDFLDTLYNYDNIIDMSHKWDIKAYKEENSKLVSSKVGLLDLHEYLTSVKNIDGFREDGNYYLGKIPKKEVYSKGYLKINNEFWLLTPVIMKGTGELYHEFVHSNGINYSSNTDSNLRPAIYIKSSVNFSKGNGTKDDPYIIDIDKPVGNSGALLNTRISGEYLMLDNELYRIVGTENDKTKITKVDYVRDSNNKMISREYPKYGGSYFGGAIRLSEKEYVDAFLAKVWYPSLSKSYQSMIDTGIFYIGKYDITTQKGDFIQSNYKLALCQKTSLDNTTKDCKKVTSVYDGKIGLLRIGEMFAAQLNNNYSFEKMWLITIEDSYTPIWLSETGAMQRGHLYKTDYSIGMRPTFYLKSDVKIISGMGLENVPYVISQE